jgi:hypothetical protein
MGIEISFAYNTRHKTFVKTHKSCKKLQDKY